MPSTTITGCIASIRFTNERFTIGSINCDSTSKTITFTCPAALVRGQEVSLHGQWSTHPRYGRQFAAASLTIDIPINPKGLARFLAVLPAAKGIGPVKGQQIAEAYGANFEDILLNNPDELCTRFGLQAHAITELQAAWQHTRSSNAVATQLAAYDLSYHQISTIATLLGPNAAILLKEDPYRLIGAADGLGFTRIDQVAQRMGTAKNHVGRLRAGLLHIITETVQEGHCWIAEDELLRHGIHLLALDDLSATNVLRTQLQALTVCGKIVSYAIEQTTTYTLPHLATWEADVAQWIADSNKQEDGHAAHICEIDILKQVPRELNETQILAVLQAFQHPASVMTGGAGVGKTFTVASIVRIAQNRNMSVHMAAPTGKAAQRMSEQVQAHACGQNIPATTIHRLLAYNPELGWQHNADNPLTMDLLIIDETSMIDAELAYRLTQAIDLTQTRVIFVGDPHQLPPVGAGAFLRDILRSEALPITTLSTVMRQAGVLRERSLAILNGQCRATARDGENIAKGQRSSWHVLSQCSDAQQIPAVIQQLWNDILPNRFGLRDTTLLKSAQILTPTHRGSLGTRAINQCIQTLIHGQQAVAQARREQKPQKRDPLLPGDKIVWTRNDYDLDIFNGQIGIIENITSTTDDAGHTQAALLIRFDERVVTVPRDKWNRLQLAYALTVHKAQGSEWPCCIVICHKTHSMPPC